MHAKHAPDVPVKVIVRDGPEGLLVEVTDVGPAAAPVSCNVGDLLEADEGDPRVALAVLAGLVDEIKITSTDSGTTVSLRWPLPPRAV